MQRREMGPLHSGSGVDKGDSRVDDFTCKWSFLP